jgi:hypothetical protein
VIVAKGAIMKIFPIFFLVGLLSLGAYGQSLPSLVISDSVDPYVKKQLIGDLNSLRTIEGGWASMLHRQIYGELSGPKYLKFFLDRIRVINYENTESSESAKNAIAYYDSFSDEMYLTQNFVKFKHPQIARLMTLFHESRHAEKIDVASSSSSFLSSLSSDMKYVHIDCPNEFKNWKGQPVHSIWSGINLAGQAAACDDTEFGAYGAAAILLKNIQKYCSTCTAKMKMDAGLYADDQIQRVVDKKAFRRILKDLYTNGL